MSPDQVLGRLRQLGVLPVIAIDSAAAALPLADALIAGGLPAAEITFRTDAAEESIRLLKDKRPELLLGAGTVLTPNQMQRALEAGAEFAVSPGLNPTVVRAAREKGFPFFPGVATPTEIETAMGFGLKALKYFPAGPFGGPAMIKTLSGPYGPAGVQFLPTGGVSPSNLAEYLGIATVVSVGGTWIAPRERIAAKDWQGIRDACLEARRILLEVRKA